MSRSSTSIQADDLVLLLGRLAIAALFLPSGFEKLLDYGAFEASLVAKGVPFATALAPLAVATEAGGGLLLLLGVEIRWISLLMIAFVFMATATSHRFWDYQGAVRYAQSINFFKNSAIIGGFLFLHVTGAGALSWDGWRRRSAAMTQRSA